MGFTSARGLQQPGQNYPTPSDEAELRALAFAGAEIGAWRWSADADEFVCDETASRLLSVEGVQPRTRSRLITGIHPEDRGHVRLRLDLCRQAGAPVVCSFRLGTGNCHWIELTARRGPGGWPSILVGTVRDISAAKQVETALRDSEAKLTNVFAQTMVGILHRDRDNNILMVNDRFLELVGRTQAELAGVPFEDFTHPDDLVWNIPQLDNCTRTGTPFTIEKRYLRPDGSAVWCEVNVTFVRGSGGERDSTIVFANEITGRKLAEAERKRASDMLHLALDGAGAGTWEADRANGWSLQLSVQAKRIYGLSDEHSGELSYDEWAALLDPESLTHIDEEFRTFATSDRSHSAEFKVRSSDGQERWLRIHGRAVLDDSGLPRKVAGIVYDDSARKHAEEKSRQSEERLRLTQEAARIGVFVSEADGRTTGSPQFFANLGLPPETQSIDRNAREALIHGGDRSRVMEEIGDAIRAGKDFVETEYRIVRACDGDERWVLARVKIERDDDGSLLRFVGAHLDVTEGKLAALKLKETMSINEGIVEASIDCIKVLDLDGTLRFMSQRGLQTMEADGVDGILGMKWQSLWPQEAYGKVEEAISLARSGGIGRFDAACVTLKGNPMWVDVVVTPLRSDGGQVNQLLAITRDVTELRAQAERARWAAEHDALTGVPNRNYFDDALTQIIASAQSAGEQIGLLALDVDNFKQVNDAFGHDAGDRLLQALAQRVEEILEEGDFVARLGGDEFAIVVRHLERGRDLLKFGALLNQKAKQPVAHNRYVLDCRVSIGAATYPAHGKSRDELLKSADTALYAAKTAGRNNMLMFKASLRSELDRRSAMIGMARSTIERRDILPFYQPKVCLRTGAVKGFEALLRWRDPSGDIRPPGEIEAAFEDFELAREISERMQDQILEDLTGWLQQGLAIEHVAINAAAAEFSRNDFASHLLGKFDAAGISPRHLQVEVTETVFMGRGADHVGEALKVLKSRGVEIALDDFGTGYASLSHLKKFPVDVIKIDRSFITDLGQDAGDTAIVCALLTLAAELKMAVVAEGIETAAQAAFLRARNCTFGQGYYFGKPVSAESVPGLVGKPLLVT